jgi:hypothetical protein
VLTLRDKVLPSSMQAIKFSCEHRLGNFHFALGGGGSLELPPGVKRALTMSEPSRGG